MFGLVAQRTKSILLADKAFHYGAGQYLVVSVDLPVTSRIIAASEGDPYLSIGLILRPKVIASLLLESGTDDQSTVDAAAFIASRRPRAPRQERQAHKRQVRWPGQRTAQKATR
jgi:AraC-type transcriptional regulator N-terminus